jgi:hypothetical protein
MKLRQETELIKQKLYLTNASWNSVDNLLTNY